MMSGLMSVRKRATKATIKIPPLKAKLSASSNLSPNPYENDMKTIIQDFDECFQLIRDRKLAAIKIYSCDRPTLYRKYDKGTLELHDIGIVAWRYAKHLCDKRAYPGTIKRSVGDILVTAGRLHRVRHNFVTTTIIIEEDGREHVSRS